MSSKTYSGISLNKAQALLKAAGDHGAQINGDLKTGDISDYGCTVKYAYDSAKQSLVLTVTQKPFFLSDAFVFQQIEQYGGLAG